MKLRTALAMAALAMTMTAPLALSGPGHSGDEERAYGAPGDPSKVKRTITIEMSETDDGMLFKPASISVRRGEHVRLKLVNKGAGDHELVLATRAENDKHAIEMAKNPDMEHDDPNAIRLQPGKKGEIIWNFSKAGKFDFACLIPGHRESGMHGEVSVN